VNFGGSPVINPGSRFLRTTRRPRIGRCPSFSTTRLTDVESSLCIA